MFRKKRIYFILADENLFHPFYLKELLKKLNKKEYAVVGITILEHTPPKGFIYFLTQQLQLWGVLGFLFIALNSLSRSIFEYIHNNIPTIKNIGRKYKIPVIKVTDVNDLNHINYINKKQIDIIISSCGQIFKKRLLAVPKIACINRHTALLPKYGGVLPVFWAMYRHEKKFGVSVHYMIEAVDKGEVLYQEAIPIQEGISLFRNYVLGFEISVSVTLKALENLRYRKVMHSLSPNKDQYFSHPTFKQMKDFRRYFNSFSLKDAFVFFKKY